jgi:hypothetical protein
VLVLDSSHGMCVFGALLPSGTRSRAGMLVKALNIILAPVLLLVIVALGVWAVAERTKPVAPTAPRPPSRRLTDVPFLAPGLVLVLVFATPSVGGALRSLVLFLGALLLATGFFWGAAVAVIGHRWGLAPGQRVIAAVGVLWAVVCAVSFFFLALLHAYGPGS